MKQGRKVWEPLPTLEERSNDGKTKREQTPREAHSSSAYDKADRVDPVSLIIDSNEDRLPDLVPIRHSRMLQSPFAFFRGAALIMAEDLSYTPNSGIYVQSCGDCHLMNFGGYATPERKQVFDINDFDETLSAPFEWDLKRLAASIVLAGRYRGFADKENKKAAFSAVKMYAEKMQKYATMHQLDIWYSRLDKKTILELFKSEEEFTKRFKLAASKAKRRTQENAFPKLSAMQDGKRKIVDEPPLIYHLPDNGELFEKAQVFFDGYLEHITDDKKALLRRFRLVDVAVKVVGVGSVGTRCYIALFMAEDDDPLILQFKEAKKSVLESYNPKTPYKNHGERIVNGQKLMQAVSDIFLGWTRSNEGRDFYVRQLRDMKASANIDNFTPGIYSNYALLCGWALAKSHAKSGMSPEIAGYVGKSDVFAEAIAGFAVGYADQTEKDYEALLIAAQNGRISVQAEV
ncbi:DUF2252 domain-containing protein [Mucilaginibacter jinjuensis]|uniref:DUF2252 domain-containing protein n=1 Tax=Mucilaginibacter jinjuensis TaxID=1176721 RepID=A0ABY7T136_9SPHI|nr:DUF2252 domain-containing protein [Mucilaginibacter jinjuensis]WCT09993.1 DUF2252 domain-containing protein [Mucilaginibacter jinjuensis]